MTIIVQVCHVVWADTLEISAVNRIPTENYIITYAGQRISFDLSPFLLDYWMQDSVYLFTCHQFYWRQARICLLTCHQFCWMYIFWPVTSFIGCRPGYIFDMSPVLLDGGQDISFDLSPVLLDYCMQDSVYLLTCHQFYWMQARIYLLTCHQFCWITGCRTVYIFWPVTSFIGCRPGYIFWHVTSFIGCRPGFIFWPVTNFIWLLDNRLWLPGQACLSLSLIVLETLRISLAENDSNPNRVKNPRATSIFLW